MAETLESLRTELLARGFDYLVSAGTTRADRFINDAYTRLCNMALWPFREAEATGPAPLVVADLGVIESVRNTANGNDSLSWRDRRTLVDDYSDLAAPGTPCFFYIEDGDTIKTFPVGGELSVKYWRRALKLVSNTDEIIVPDDYSDIVIDLAARRAYIDSDNFAAANALKADVNERVNEMMIDLLIQQVHDDRYIEVRDGEEYM